MICITEWDCMVRSRYSNTSPSIIIDHTTSHLRADNAPCDTAWCGPVALTRPPPSSHETAWCGPVTLTRRPPSSLMTPHGAVPFHSSVPHHHHMRPQPPSSASTGLSLSKSLTTGAADRNDPANLAFGIWHLYNHEFASVDSYQWKYHIT